MVRIARNTLSAIFEALLMRSDIIHFRLRLYVIEKPKYCMDLTHSISKFPYLKFSLTKLLFDNTIDFVLLTLTSKPHLAQYPCSLSKHRCKPFFDVDIRSRSSAHDILLKEMFSNTMGSHSAKISCRSFWKIFDSIGLMQHPCFTTSEADIWYEVLLYILFMMLYTFPVMLYLSNLYKKVSIDFIKEFWKINKCRIKRFIPCVDVFLINGI